jgi:hypothetical protein
MWRVTKGYVALLNTEQNSSTINEAKGRPEKICPNTTRLTNAAGFGIHWIFKLGLLAKNICLYILYICNQEEINTIKTTITSNLCRS